MSFTKYLIPEFDQEMQSTRRTLERVPDGQFDWKPHPKSSSLGALASHVAQLPDFVSLMFSRDSFDFRPPGGTAYASARCATTAELLELFDASVAKAREAMAAARDDQMEHTWTLSSAGQPFISLPRWSMYRTVGMNHMVHHRAQLGVYLRLLDVPVPGTYGPSADTPMG